MRLLLLLTLLPQMVLAFVKVESIYRVYNDGETEVQSPKVDVSTKIMRDRATIRVGYAADILTSASSDVRSYGTRPKISDYRKEYDGTFSMEVEDGTLGWTYINSTENDYRSNTFAFAGTREFFEKNTTLFMAFSYGDDKIGKSIDRPDDYKSMTNENYSLGLTQILSKKSIAQLLYDLRVESGYLSSPYRRARISNADGSVRLEPENHPLVRSRHSLALKYNTFWSGIDAAFATTLRAYLDNWGVSSVTVEERMTKKIGERFDIALNLRYYTQTEASFYQDKYTDSQPFETGNKTLSRYDSITAGIRPTMKISENLSAYAKYEYYTIDYKNHTDVGTVASATDDKMLKIKANIYGIGIEGEF